MDPRKSSLCEFSCTGHVYDIMDPLSEFSAIALTTHLSRIPHTLHTLLTYTSYISHVNLTHTLLTYTPHIHSSHTLLTYTPHTHTPHIHLTHIAHSSYTISSHTLTLMPHTHTSHRDGKEVAVVYFRSGYSPDQYSSPDGTVRHC